MRFNVLKFLFVLSFLLSLIPINSWAGSDCDFVDLSPVSLLSPQYSYSSAGDLEQRSLRPSETIRGPWIPLITYDNNPNPDGSYPIVGFTAVNVVNKKKWLVKPLKVQMGTSEHDDVKIDVVDLPDQLADKTVFHVYKKKGVENYDQHELFELDGNTGKTKTLFYWKGGEYELGPMYVVGEVAVFVTGSDDLSPYRQIQLYSLKTGKMLVRSEFNFADHEGYANNEFIGSNLLNGNVNLRFTWRGNPGNWPARSTPSYILTKDAIAASASNPNVPITLKEDSRGDNFKLSPDHIEITTNGYKIQEKGELTWFQAPAGINVRNAEAALYLRNTNLIVTFIDDVRRGSLQGLLLGTCRPDWK